MPILRSLALLLVLPLAVPAADAEEPPHLEFVRGLRARGMPDLALQYLESLGPKPPAELAAILPLERAKARLEAAALDPDASRRAAAENQARAELEAFVRDNPKHPLAAEAGLEIARVAALHAQALARQARENESREAQRAQLAQARSLFEEASKRLQEAAGRIDDRLKDAQGAEKETLDQARLRAELELGINLLRQAQTYTDSSDDAKRGEVLKRATGTFDKLAAKRETLRDPICWQALAWLGRCSQENEDPKAARKVYSEILAERGEAVEAAKRLARAFRLETLAHDPDEKNPLPQVQKAAEEWLGLYPDFQNTPEGIKVRFTLADAYFQQALRLPKAQQNGPRARDLYERAQRLFQALEQSRNEFTTKAHENNEQIVLIVSQGRSRGDIFKLRDFQECYLRARLEVAELGQDAKKLSGTKLEERRQEHYRNLLTALGRGFDLADGRVSPDELNDARYLQAYANLAAGDYYAAAVCGEELARTQPRSPRAPMAAAYALRAYALVIAQQEQAGTAREDLAADRQRLSDLAGYIERTWPADPAADIARHTLALVALRDRNYPAAIEALERITAGYADATRALYQLAGAALQAQKEDAKPPPGQPSYTDRAIAALRRMPELTDAAEPATVHDYFAGKLTLADLYYQAKQYDKVQELADALLKKLDGLDERTKTEHRSSVLALSLYAQLGRAEAECQAGKFAAARTVLEPVVRQLEDPAGAARLAEVKEKNPKLVRAVLGMALRASVQDSKIEQGRKVLELIQKQFPDNALDSLILLVEQLHKQIEQLRKQGEPAKVRLEQTVSSFSTFLEMLAKQQELNPRPEVLLFLARSYSSLDEHTKAAIWAERIREPLKAPGAKEPDRRLLELYRIGRLLFARELRLSKDFDRAGGVLKELEGTPWGARSFDVKKERIFLLEDRGKYKGKDGAILAWNSLMTGMRDRLQDARVKEHYFESYYHLTHAIYKNALRSNDPKRRAEEIRLAANFILKLEAQPERGGSQVQKRFEELLQQEAPLREEYEALKKGEAKDGRK
jgi:hypothetical protein